MYESLAKGDGSFAVAWVVEPGEENGRLHIQGVMRADSMGQARFQKVATANGLGRARVRPRVSEPIVAARYTLKQPLRAFDVENAEAVEILDRHVSRNSKRMIQSRGPFWLDPWRRILSGIGEAVSVSGRRYRGDVVLRPR
jgi:hypothetical protein